MSLLVLAMITLAATFWPLDPRFRGDDGNCYIYAGSNYRYRLDFFGDFATTPHWGTVTIPKSVQLFFLGVVYGRS